MRNESNCPEQPNTTSLRRSVADQAFSWIGGAPLVSGSRVRLLKGAAENYPSWRTRSCTSGGYIIHDDPARREYAKLLSAKARAGVAVRLLFGAHGDAVAFAHAADRAAEAVDDAHRFVAEREVPPIAHSKVCTSDVQTSAVVVFTTAPVPPGSGTGFSAIPTSPILDMTNALSMAVVPTPRASTVQEAGPGRVPAARPARYQSAPRTRG